MLIASKLGFTTPSPHDVQVQPDVPILMRGVKRPGRRRNAEFLHELTAQRILRRFACFQMPTGHIPTSCVRFAGRTQSEQDASIAYD
jgi:hypothetical protein